MNQNIDTMNPSLSATYNWPGTSEQAVALGVMGVAPNSPGFNIIIPAYSIYYPSNLWAWCVASGFDAPGFWNAEFAGSAGIDAITQPILCGAKWHTNSDKSSGCLAATETFNFFPKVKGDNGK
jgi:hypothetical protein